MNKAIPLLIGITGGIGAGKTTVTKIFSTLGVPVYLADDRAKWLMENSSDLKTSITNAFGKESYLPDGSLNRTYLANEVFSDQKKTKTINSLVHPAVKKDFVSWAEKQNSPYVLKEAALLFETDSYKDLHKVINVSAPVQTRIQRIMARDPQRTEKQILAIMERQLSEEEKNKLADFIINNSEEDKLIPQVLKIHQRLKDQA